jgi:hypothetical protein
MARKSSPPYSEPLEVRISRATLERRWTTLLDGLRTCCELLPGDFDIRADSVEDEVTAGLVGRVCELVRRNRGRPTFVAPFTKIGGNGLRSWLGFREKWELTSGKLYRFHHVSLTVHFGYEGDILKPQIFRSEWPGIRPWRGEEIGFQSSGAGQPHWQFDAVQSTLDMDTETATGALARLRGEETVADFDAQSVRLDAIVAARHVPIERFHFASAAPWWKIAASLHPKHMNAPPDADGILRWILACANYMRQELERC